jgi:hypothetical protein
LRRPVLKAGRYPINGYCVMLGIFIERSILVELFYVRMGRGYILDSASNLAGLEASADAIISLFAMVQNVLKRLLKNFVLLSNPGSNSTAK